MISEHNTTVHATLAFDESMTRCTLQRIHVEDEDTLTDILSAVPIDQQVSFDTALTTPDDWLSILQSKVGHALVDLPGFVELFRSKSGRGAAVEVVHKDFDIHKVGQTTLVGTFFPDNHRYGHTDLSREVLFWPLVDVQLMESCTKYEAHRRGGYTHEERTLSHIPVDQIGKVIVGESEAHNFVVGQALSTGLFDEYDTGGARTHLLPSEEFWRRQTHGLFDRKKFTYHLGSASLQNDLANRAGSLANWAMRQVRQVLYSRVKENLASDATKLEKRDIGFETAAAFAFVRGILPKDGYVMISFPKSREVHLMGSNAGVDFQNVANALGNELIERWGNLDKSLSAWSYSHEVESRLRWLATDARILVTNKSPNAIRAQVVKKTLKDNGKRQKECLERLVSWYFKQFYAIGQMTLGLPQYRRMEFIGRSTSVFDQPTSYFHSRGEDDYAAGELLALNTIYRWTQVPEMKYLIGWTWRGYLKRFKELKGFYDRDGLRNRFIPTPHGSFFCVELPEGTPLKKAGTVQGVYNKTPVFNAGWLRAYCVLADYVSRSMTQGHLMHWRSEVFGQKPVPKSQMVTYFRDRVDKFLKDKGNTLDITTCLPHKTVGDSWAYEVAEELTKVFLFQDLFNLNAHPRLW